LKAFGKVEGAALDVVPVTPTGLDEKEFVEVFIDPIGDWAANELVVFLRGLLSKAPPNLVGWTVYPPELS
jgi:hypothetical protein